jgi:hypothetical protein
VSAEILLIFLVFNPIMGLIMDNLEKPYFLHNVEEIVIHSCEGDDKMNTTIPRRDHFLFHETRRTRKKVRATYYLLPHSYNDFNTIASFSSLLFRQLNYCLF